MDDNEKALFHQFETASHSEGYAQFLYQLMGGWHYHKRPSKRNNGILQSANETQY